MYESIWSILLDWYARCQRDFLWRHTRDPYAILIAETMLQQTGVERVIAHYPVFLTRFPTLHDLAQAPTADIIRQWQGLGYNRRAVYLQQTARRALERWGGLPHTIEDLLTLPGVGQYTARAVACFAFAVETAVCDVNVRRVLTRLLRGQEDRRLSPAAALALAASVLPPGRARDWNQGLMDFGSAVCTGANPRCQTCPLQARCLAFPVTRAPASRANAIADARPRWQEEPFAGSRRYYRGRVVNALCTPSAGEALALSALGPRIKPGFTPADAPWLRALVEELVADGLARLENDTVALP